MARHRAGRRSVRARRNPASRGAEHVQRTARRARRRVGVQEVSAGVGHLVADRIDAGAGCCGGRAGEHAVDRIDSVQQLLLDFGESRQESDGTYGVIVPSAFVEVQLSAEQ